MPWIFFILRNYNNASLEWFSIFFFLTFSNASGKLMFSTLPFSYFTVLGFCLHERPWNISKFSLHFLTSHINFFHFDCPFLQTSKPESCIFSSWTLWLYYWHDALFSLQTLPQTTWNRKAQQSVAMLDICTVADIFLWNHISIFLYPS